MSYRKRLSKFQSKRKFTRNNKSKKINHIPKMGVRGGIRL